MGTLVELARKTILGDFPGRAGCRDSASAKDRPAEHRTQVAAARQAAVGADHSCRFEHRRSRLDDLERRRARRVESHTVTKGIDLKNAGGPEQSPLLVSKAMLFVAGGPGLFNAGPRAGTRVFRAIDKKTGSVIHEMTLPASTTGVPMP